MVIDELSRQLTMHVFFLRMLAIISFEYVHCPLFQAAATTHGRMVPSLLNNKENLSVPLKTTGASTVKQLYVRKEREDAGPAARLGSGTKRPLNDPESQRASETVDGDDPSKRIKRSVFHVIGKSS